MFKTKNLVHDIKDVPVTWVFEHYCKLKERLTGQDIKIKSLFQDERTPSMCIYMCSRSGTYRFKDFSSGKGGCSVELVKQIHEKPYHQACQIIVEDYNDYVLHNNGGYDLQEFKVRSRYHIESFVSRQWTSRDAYYWTQFNIGSRLLGHYNVLPIEEYRMKKDEVEEGKYLTIKGLYIYGYFKKDCTLYKIYQPKTQDKKFLKVQSYIQGIEQLENKKWLVVTSSLKDLMSLKSLKLEVDAVAPDSENTMIPSQQMETWIESYKKVLILFDNDDAGINAMKKYKERYPTVEPILLNMSKDLSDSIKDQGAGEVRTRLVPLINRKISE